MALGLVSVSQGIGSPSAYPGVMLLTYLFCLFGGAVLITLSISGDADTDADADIGEGGPASVLLGSSFWSFAMAGFGLSGLLLKLLQPGLAGLVALLMALLIGLGLGWGAGRCLRFLGRRQVNSLIRSEDLVGLEARVTLSVEPTRRGLVEVLVRGSLLRRPALSASGTLQAGERALVLQCDNNTLIVVRLDD